MQVPQDYGQDTGSGSSHCQEHIRGGSCCPDQGGFQEDRARVRRGRDIHRRHALPRAAPVCKVSPAHEILRQEEKVHQQYQRVRQPGRGGDRHIKKHRRVSRRHHAAQGTPHAVWKVGGGDARSGPARIRQVPPPLRRPRLPGNRRPPARHHAGDPVQEDQGHAADAGAKKATTTGSTPPGCWWSTR